MGCLLLKACELDMNSQRAGEGSLFIISINRLSLQADHPERWASCTCRSIHMHQHKTMGTYKGLIENITVICNNLLNNTNTNVAN